VLAAGSRHVQLNLFGGIDPYALLITGDSQDAQVACLSSYVQADGTLDDLSIFQTTEQWGPSRFAHGPEILPSTAYNVQADFGTPGAPDLGPLMPVTTAVWADTDGNNAADFADILFMVQGFEGTFNGPSLQSMDIEPCNPNGAIDFGDILLAVKAFEGETYAFTNCPIPCP
jgi:hypothetical protein